MIYHVHEALMVFVLYLIHYKATKKALYISAFFFTEAFIYSPMPLYLDEILFSFFCATIYIPVYFIAYRLDERLQTRAAIIIAIGLDMGTLIDAILYKGVETVFSNSYPILYVGVHLLIVCSFIRYGYIKSIMGQVSGAFSSMFGHIYHYSFFWYTVRKVFKKSSK